MYLDELVIEKNHKCSTDGVQFRLNGCVNANTYHKLEGAIFDAFDKGRYNVELHLGGVQYMTSAGAGVLINARCEATKNHGEVVLVSASSHVHEVLDLLGLTDLFPIDRTR